MQARLRFSLMIVLLLSFTVFAGTILAQEGTPISYGQTVTGDTTSGAARFTFTAQTGDLITVSVVAPEGSALDPFVELYGTQEYSLLGDDDSGGDLNALLGPYLINEPGTYTIVVSGCCGPQPSSAGTFELALNQLSTTPMTANAPNTFSLTNAQPFLVFTLDGAAITEPLMMISGTKDDPQRNYLVEVTNTEVGYISNLYSGTPNNPPVMDVIINRNVPLYFIVRRDSYKLNDTQDIPTSGSLTVTGMQPQPLTRDTALTGTLSDENPFVAYQFDTTLGEQLRLDAQPGEGASYEVRVVGPSGYTITGGVATPGSLVLDPIGINEEGPYLLYVLRSLYEESETTNATYNITLSASTAVELTDGTAVNGTIASDTYEQIYRFQGTAAQRIRVTVTSVSPNYGPGVSVWSPDNMQLVNSFSSVPGTSSHEIELPAAGTYLIRVSNGNYAIEPGTSGEYSLVVETIQ